MTAKTEELELLQEIHAVVGEHVVNQLKNAEGTTLFNQYHEFCTLLRDFTGIKTHRDLYDLYEED
jgi:hypothetical protein